MLEATPPNGKEFLRKIEHVLEREKNWVGILSHLSLTLICAPIFFCMHLGLFALITVNTCVAIFQVWWKRDGCLPFEKQLMEEKAHNSAKKRYADIISTFKVQERVILESSFKIYS